MGVELPLTTNTRAPQLSRIGKSQRQATPASCFIDVSLTETPMLKDLLKKECQRFWLFSGFSGGSARQDPRRERRSGQFRPQRAMAQGVSRPDYCPRIGWDLIGDGVDVLHRLAAR